VVGGDKSSSRARRIRQSLGLRAFRTRHRATRRVRDVVDALAGPESFPEARKRLARRYLRGSGIEIGGLDAPLKLVRGVSVRYVDRWTLEELRRQYPELADVELVRPDILDDGETLTTVAAESIDFVIANHFIEHTENPIGTIEQHLRVLRRDGVLFYAIPDKRQTFDRDRPVTPLDHVVSDYRDGPEKSRRAHVEEWVEHMEGGVAARVDELMSGARSIHWHVWTAVQILELFEHCRRELGLPIEVLAFEQVDHEVIVVLRKAS
jgi:SAM-dependent methyltransferase